MKQNEKHPRFESDDKKNFSGSPKIKIMTATVSLFIFIIIILVSMEICIYFTGAENPLINKISSIVPFPAVIVNNRIIRISDLKNNINAVKNFYENQDFQSAGLRIDFSTSDGKKRLKIKERRILTKMIEDVIIEQEANRRGIKLSSEEINAEVTKKIGEYGDEQSLKNNMKKLYDWKMKDFERNIVKPDLYALKLYENMRQNDEAFMKARTKIKQAQNDLSKSKDFESVVAKYSEGESVKDRGDLGWFSYDETLPEIAQVISVMEKGETSDIIESSLGYHIINVKDKKTENDVEKFHIKQIFVRAPQLSQWLTQKEKEIRILSLMKDYHWNTTDGEMQFKDNNLEAFEKNLEKNSADDISIMF